MTYLQAIKNLNRSLTKRKPPSFNPAWVRNCVRKSYNFIVENIKTKSDDTDWDQIIRCLDHDHQKMWMKGRKRKLNLKYEDAREVDAILNKYHDKFYTFLTQIDNSDKNICDEIDIRLVRTAQKGNLLAKQKTVFFITQLVDYWIETRNLQHWRGYDDLIEKNIERCIRRYRYSGSFTVYLYRTLEYAGRGLRSLEMFSLDENSPITDRKKADSLVYDSETGETRLFS